MPHKREIINRRVVEHNLHTLEYQSSALILVHQYLNYIVLFIVIIRFWKVFDKARLISTNEIINVRVELIIFLIYQLEYIISLDTFPSEKVFLFYFFAFLIFRRSNYIFKKIKR